MLYGSSEVICEVDDASQQMKIHSHFFRWCMPFYLRVNGLFQNTSAGSAVSTEGLHLWIISEIWATSSHRLKMVYGQLFQTPIWSGRPSSWWMLAIVTSVLSGRFWLSPLSSAVDRHPPWQAPGHSYMDTRAKTTRFVPKHLCSCQNVFPPFSNEVILKWGSFRPIIIIILFMYLFSFIILIILIFINTISVIIFSKHYIIDIYSILYNLWIAVQVSLAHVLHNSIRVSVANCLTGWPASTLWHASMRLSHRPLLSYTGNSLRHVFMFIISVTLCSITQYQHSDQSFQSDKPFFYIANES